MAAAETHANAPPRSPIETRAKKRKLAPQLSLLTALDTIVQLDRADSPSSSSPVASLPPSSPSPSVHPHQFALTYVPAEPPLRSHPPSMRGLRRSRAGRLGIKAEPTSLRPLFLCKRRRRSFRRPQLMSSISYAAIVVITFIPFSLTDVVNATDFYLYKI